MIMHRLSHRLMTWSRPSAGSSPWPRWRDPSCSSWARAGWREVAMRGLESALQLPTPLQELHDERLGGVRVFLKRDDLIHPELTGNKWRKLKYLLADARAAS